jgi:hypothetical protein
VATYDPYGSPAASFGAPSKAVDGNPSTSWTYQLDPSTAGATKAGLVVDLKPAQAVEAIILATTSPGMTVEVYGAVGTLPTRIGDPAWIHLASRSDIKAQARLDLSAHGHEFDHLLIWITHAPPGVNAGALTISELSVVS